MEEDSYSESSEENLDFQNVFGKGNQLKAQEEEERRKKEELERKYERLTP